MVDGVAVPQPVARERANPLFNDNKLKLGLFCFNVSGVGFTTVPERYKANWPRSVQMLETMDRIGLEAMVTAAQWRGPVFGNLSHPSHNEYEPFTWCAGLGALSKHCALVATFHAQIHTPTFVAKAVTTLDHITGGRCAINIVAGASKVVHDVFGKTVEDHETRYRHTEEFIELLHRLWTSDQEFDHSGEFFMVTGGLSVPRPLQQPYPPIMNAGVSSRGRAFAAQYADLAFTLLHEGKEDYWKGEIDAYRQLAKEEFGREIQIWTHGFVVIRATESEAEDFLRYYAEENVDQEWLDAWIRELGEGMPTLRPEQQALMQRKFAAGGGMALVGTADQVAEKIKRMSDAGVDGILLTSIEPEDMLDRVERELLPRLEKMELRKPFEAAHPD